MTCTQVLVDTYNQFVERSELDGVDPLPPGIFCFCPMRNEVETGLWMSIRIGIFADGGSINSAELIIYDPKSEEICVRFVAIDTDHALTSNITTTCRVGFQWDSIKGKACMNIRESVENARARRQIAPAHH